ncbi:MAG: hypothetical protein AB1646_13060 [Thermodesulfobacteriota bacterium]
MLLRRIISLVACTCLLGLTAVPAAYVPCCCKTRLAPDKADGHKGCCAKPAPQPSCCAQAKEMGCLVGSTVSAPCPHCRCIEQMQVVALTGVDSSEVSTRFMADAYTVVADQAVDVSTIMTLPSPEKCPPGIPLLHKTCVILC